MGPRFTAGARGSGPRLRPVIDPLLDPSADAYTFPVSSRHARHLHSTKAPHQLATPRRHDSRPSPAFVRVDTGRVSARDAPAGCPGGGSRIATPAGCGDAVVLRDRHCEPKGFEAENRREGWSPEPGHLLGGELGGEGGQGLDRKARGRRKPQRQQRQRGGQAARRRTAWWMRSGRRCRRVPERRAKEVRIGTN